MVSDAAGWHVLDSVHAGDATTALDYKRHSIDVGAYRGKTVTLWFWADQNGTNRTQYLIDDVSLTTTPQNSL